jgi:hypothetical protein
MTAVQPVNAPAASVAVKTVLTVVITCRAASTRRATQRDVHTRHPRSYIFHQFIN